MSEVNLTVCPFMMGDDKDAALKVLEEAAEAYGAWDDYHDAITPVPGEFFTGVELRFECLSDEIADCIQACVNLAARYGVDLPAALNRCYVRNLNRGRYDRQMSETAKRVFDRLMDDSAGKADDAQ